MNSMTSTAIGFGDKVVQYIYVSIATLSSGFDLYKLFILAKFPHSFALMAAGNMINVATTVYASNDGKPPLYWLHSLILCILGGTGGGIAAGPLLGRSAGIINNGDILVPLIIIAWYTTHYLGFQSVYQFLPIKLIWAILLGLYRTHTVIDVVNIANKSLSPTMYYPTPFIGPIIAGTINGCFGAFLPFDRGLGPISNGTPWSIQAPFMTSLFYHALVNDTNGFIGIAFRSVFGSYNETDVRVIIGTVQVLTLLFQTIFNAQANLFTPIHKVGYLLFQVTGPVGANTNKSSEDTVGWDYHTRIFLERVLEVSRVVAVIAVISGHIYLTQPPSVLASGQLFKVGDSLGTCQLLSTLQNCKPYLLTLESKLSSSSSSGSSSSGSSTNPSFTLASYSAKGKSFQPSADDIPVWSLSMKTNPKVKIRNDAVKGIILGEDGVVRLIMRSETTKQDELLWSSSSKCPTGSSEGSRILYLSLNSDGNAVVTCPDGSLVPLV